MDRYISHRKRDKKEMFSFGGVSIRRKKSATFEEPRVKPMDKEYEEIDAADEADQVDDQIDEEPKKKGGIKGVFGFLKRKPKEEVEEDSETEPDLEALDPDVKEVLKLSLRWIEQLPPSKLREFKSSQDFEKFKNVLLKHGIAKKIEKV